MLPESFYKKVIALIFAVGFFCSFFYLYNQKIVIDSQQLLERGYLFTQGFLFPFGPRSTNTNYVFGPFVSVFVGLALKIYAHPLSALLGILGLHLVSFWTLFKIRFLREDPMFFLVYLTLFWASPWRSSEVFLWNPAFIFPFIIFFLYGIDRNLERADFGGTFLYGLMIGLCAQIHNSFLIMILFVMLMYFKKQMRVHWVSLMLSALVGVFLFAPTLYVVWRSPEILSVNQQPTRLFHNLLTVGEMIKGWSYWFRYGSLYFGSTTFQLPEIVFQQASVWEILWFAVKWIMALASFVVMVLGNVYFYKNFKQTRLFQVALCAFICLLFFSALSPVPFNFWHLYLIYPFALIPVSSYLAQKFSLKWFIPLMSYFLIYTLISGTFSYKHDSSLSQREAYQQIELRKDSLVENFGKFSLQF
jgi:hypothetical protein